MPYNTETQAKESMEETITVEFTKQELQDIRIALMDYRSKWFDLYIKGIEGKMPQNFSTEGAGLVYDAVCKLQDRLMTVDAIFA